MIKYTKEEMETVINWNMGDRFEIFISTAMPSVWRACEKAGLKPQLKCKSNRTYTANGKHFRIGISGGKFRIADRRKRKPLTPEQKKALKKLAAVSKKA